MAELAGKRMVVVGLGLIGGSLALALDGFEDYTVVGVDVSQPTLRFAREHHICPWVSEDAGREVAQADVVILCLHPQGIVQFLAEYADVFRSGALVTDVCGVKSAIMEGAACLPGTVDFIGGHPMAGKETSGIEHADGSLFQGAHYLLTPRPDSTPEHVALLNRMAAHMGCRDVISTTPERHDAMIAYTSQVMHIMAVAVCDDPELFACKGFEGGSFRDCTRVAALDVPLWTQLFSLNAPALCRVIETLEKNLHAYGDAIRSGDTALLADKLTRSADRKRSMTLE